MTLATSCVTTAPCFVSPYAGIHPQRPFHPPRRKETVGQIRRETACSPNRSKIKRENEEQKKKKKTRKEEKMAFLSIGFLVIPSLRRRRGRGRRKRRSRSKRIERIGEGARKRRMDVHVHREIANRKRERGLLFAL